MFVATEEFLAVVETLTALAYGASVATLRATLLFLSTYFEKAICHCEEGSCSSDEAISVNE